MRYDKEKVVYFIDLLLNADYAESEKQLSAFLEESTANSPPNGNGYIEHICYTLLGLTSYHKRDFDGAEVYLEKSSAGAMSPEVSSFGPNMMLAYKLSLSGRFTAIEVFLTNYIDSAAADNFPTFTPLEWIAQLQSCDSPDFGKHIFMHLATSENLLKRLEEYAVS